MADQISVSTNMKQQFSIKFTKDASKNRVYNIYINRRLPIGQPLNIRTIIWTTRYAVQAAPSSATLRDIAPSSARTHTASHSHRGAYRSIAAHRFSFADDADCERGLSKAKPG